MWNIPNILTVLRIVIIPLIVIVCFLPISASSWIALALYTFACITDFFDGWIARNYNLVSAFGRFLDPVADKILVAAIILTLIAREHITGILILPAAIILCREIIVSGLREFLAEFKVGVPVSKVGKWKTTLQMIAIGILIVSDIGIALGPISIALIGEITLWIAAILTLWSGYDYLLSGMRYIIQKDQQLQSDNTPPSG